MFKTKILLFSAFVLFLALPAISLAQSNFDYKTMEGIPGIINAGASPTFNEYVSGVYKFGLWAVGIAALLMLSIGAFMYLTSAGNNAAMGSAKGVITDALIGLVLALVAWLMLNIINPDLANPAGITGVPPATIVTSGNAVTISAAYKKLAINANSTTPLDFSIAKNDPTIRVSKNCDKYNDSFATYGKSSGVDPAMLKTIAQIESGCGANKGLSSAGACGLMQLTPATAKSLSTSLKGKSDADVCNELKNNDALSIQLSSQYIAKNQNSPAITQVAKNKESAICAGYNSGYSTKMGGSASGKNASLAASRDCPGALAFECPKNPGGLGESIVYAYNCVGLYEQNKK